MYDEVIREVGISVTQFSMLRLIALESGMTITAVGRYMSMDRTTVRRALDPIERDGLIRIEQGADRRVRYVSITAKGRRILELATPKWMQAQESLMALIGPDQWLSMRALLRSTTRAVRHREDVAV